MSLLAALNVGNSALTASQAALQVTGNNVANAGDPNYSVEVVGTNPASQQQLSPGIFIGSGVDLTSVQRQVDEALNSRLRGSVSDNNAANVSQQWSSQVENIFNALGSNSLSSQLGGFLSQWSTLANNPTDTAQRALVVQSGQSLASQYNSLSQQLNQVQGQVTQQLTGQAASASQLAGQIASLNQQILGASNNNGLGDQLDADLSQLSALVNIQTVQQGNGQINVYIGSQPLVMGNNARSLTVQTTNGSSNGQPSQQIVFSDNQAIASVTSGQLGATLTAQGQLSQVTQQLNTQASALIFGLNSLQSQGQGTQGYTSVTAANAVTDPTAALNSPVAGLAFQPTNGSFVLTVTDSSTGLSSSTLVPVSLTGQPTDTTLNSLAASLNAIPNVQASIQGGKLTIGTNNSNDQITFSQDSSGALAALGINTFFTGSNAANMGVNATLAANPNLVAAAQNGDSGDGSNALAVANLASSPQTLLGGQTLTAAYQSMINSTATNASQAASNVQTTQDVLTALQTQQASVSGVNIDQETVNMIQEQQTFQASSQIINVVNQMMTSLMQMIG